MQWIFRYPTCPASLPALRRNALRRRFIACGGQARLESPPRPDHEFIMRIFISTVQRFFHTPAVSLISAFGLTLALQGAPASAADLPTLKIGTATGPQIEALKIAAREAKVAAIPFFARVAEVNLREVDRGLIEAAQAMG
jgi:hypothetical protein